MALNPVFSNAASDDHLNIGMLSATKQITDKHTLYVAAGTVVENFRGELVTAGIAGKLNDTFSWRSAYFLYSSRIEGEERHYDHRLRGSITYQHSFGDWKFSHRSRAEFRVGDVIDGFRYRPAFNLSRPLSVASIKFGSYVEVEPIYDFRKNSNTLTLYTVGAVIPVLKRMALDVSYFRVHNYEDKKDTFGPQVKLNIKL